MKPKVFEQIELKAPIDSPVLTGTPKSPTPGTSSTDTRIATTEFINSLNPLQAKTSSVTDLNNITANGIYTLTNPVSNVPSTTAATNGPMIVLNANGCTTQIIFYKNSDWIRTKVNGSWGSWYRFTIGSASTFVQRKGSTMIGELIAANTTTYDTPQMRNITISQDEPSGGGNGDIWLRYE